MFSVIAIIRCSQPGAAKALLRGTAGLGDRQTVDGKRNPDSFS